MGAMKLTLGQVRGTLGLSQDTYRHWKTVLLPLAARKGRGACFSHGDLLALAILKSLTDQVGVPVGGLDAIARSLFEQCGKQSWAKLERLTAVVCPEDGSLSFVFDGQIPQMTQAAIIIPCGPIISVLRAALMVEQPEETQSRLRFPLAAVTAERGGRKS
jgi:DNA-binding transcriptional MerR regulator